ncbi:MAG: hypothetical protein WC129_01160 [Sphaerochaetaceae bacterium]|jgi:hypothetical protein|nr:hypothetical protein [Sphaerochaetaceae bacterium]MDX9809462.1 hypothetical protein [Sphaerochaetaceae bacterium]
MDDEATRFLSDLEARHGGSIGFRTYSTWFACNDGTVREFGVFLFMVGDMFHFEDFERKPAIFGFPIKPRKKDAPFVKYERSFSADDVESVTAVLKTKASDCAAGHIASNQINQVNSFDRLFRSLVHRVVLKDGTTYFFELIDSKKFMLALEGGRHGSV